MTSTFVQNELGEPVCFHTTVVLNGGIQLAHKRD